MALEQTRLGQQIFGTQSVTSGSSRKLTFEGQGAGCHDRRAPVLIFCLLEDVAIVLHHFSCCVWHVHIISKDVLGCHCKFSEEVPNSVIQLVSR